MLIKRLFKKIQNIVLKRKIERHTDSRIFRKVFLDSKTVLQGKNLIFDNADIHGSRIGFGTYIGKNSYLPKSVIGNFCSISDDVVVLSGRHPVHENISSYPGFFSSRFPWCSFFVNNSFAEHKYVIEDVSLVIGNDVWIGSHVLIKEGLTIGSGAILGAGSVVTKDVPPYAVVAGVPAKIIKFRFSENQIAELLDIKWWDWSLDLIESRACEFSNPPLFVKKYSKKESSKK